MVDAGVQSDHAVDLLVVRQCSTETDAGVQSDTVEQTVVASEKVDKATITDENWLLTNYTDEVDTSDVPDDVEHLVLETADKNTTTTSRDELRPESIMEEQKEYCEQGGELNNLDRFETPRIRQKLHSVHWATALNDDKDKMVLFVEEPSENFVNELLLPAPWAARSSVSKLDHPRQDRQKAVFTRSNEHMVIIEAESAEEQFKDQTTTADTVDRVATEGLLNDRIDQTSAEAAPSSHPDLIDGNNYCSAWLHQ